MSVVDFTGRRKVPGARTLRVGMLVQSVAVSSGGVGEAVRSLSVALARLPWISVEVFSLRLEGQPELDFGNVPLNLVRPGGPAFFGYSPDMLPVLRSSSIDILHVHGLWMYASVAALRWARLTGKPYVVSPHGMLDPWALKSGALKKRMARLAYEDAHLAKAAAIHALCAQEEEAVRAAGVKTPVAVLPNGVDAPPPSPAPPPWRSALPADARVLLFLGRVTPKKKVVDLIRAFARTVDAHPSWHLAVVGPVEPGYGREIDALLATGAGAGHVHVLGPAYGADRASTYAAADAFILPSVSEGLPMAALEAFSNGLPTLLTPQCNLPEAFSAGAALRIEPDEKALAEGLRTFFGLGDAARSLLGRNARRLAASTFNWDTVALGFDGLYASKVENSERFRNTAALSHRA